jgi:methionyl aminopeptidase
MMMMKTNNSLPIKKSKEQIDFYKKWGLVYGEILKEFRQTILSKKLKESYSQTFIDICISEIEKINKFQTEWFPFISERNINNIRFEEPICVSKNDCVAHGKTHFIEENDIVTFDCGLGLISYGKDYNFDAAFTVQLSNKDKWIDKPLEALKRIKKQNPNNTYELAGIIEDTATEYNLNQILQLTGHGIGENLHEPPVIHNGRGDYQPDNIFNGMIFCAEPIYTEKLNNNTSIDKVYVEEDGWSIYTQSGARASHFETMFLKEEGKLIDLLGITKWQ